MYMYHVVCMYSLGERERGRGRDREREGGRETEREGEMLSTYMLVCAELLGQQHNGDFSGSLNTHTSRFKMKSQHCPSYTEKFTIHFTYPPFDVCP